MATSGQVGETGDTAQEVVQEFTCGECNKGGQTTVATHYCPDCDQCYCKACLCDHNVIGRKDMQRWGKRATLKAKEKQEEIDAEVCLRHPEYKVDFYCGFHEDLCCSMCRTTHHRICVGPQCLVYVMASCFRVNKYGGPQYSSLLTAQ